MAQCGRCRPDGFGLYSRRAARYGFFLEYDRGTERHREYAAKLAAYYRYRDSGQAARDFAGFPTVLFVTTDPRAERRIAEQAHRAWLVRGGPPLLILITTTGRIAAHVEGILGPIWRTPAATQSPADADRHYWLPGGPPRGLYGIGRQVSSAPRLVWPAASAYRTCPQTGGSHASGA